MAGTTQLELTTAQAADVVIAEGFGWQARKDGTAKAPAQCKNIAPLLKKYNGPVGGELSKVLCALLDAWNRGFQSCHLELTK